MWGCYNLGEIVEREHKWPTSTVSAHCWLPSSNTPLCLPVSCRPVVSSLPTWWTCWGSSHVHDPCHRGRLNAWWPSSTASSAPSRHNSSRAPARPSWSWGPASSTPGQRVTLLLGWHNTCQNLPWQWMTIHIQVVFLMKNKTFHKWTVVHGHTSHISNQIYLSHTHG